MVTDIATTCIMAIGASIRGFVAKPAVDTVAAVGITVVIAVRESSNTFGVKFNSKVLVDC